MSLYPHLSHSLHHVLINVIIQIISGYKSSRPRIMHTSQIPPLTSLNPNKLCSNNYPTFVGFTEVVSKTDFFPKILNQRTVPLSADTWKHPNHQVSITSHLLHITQVACQDMPLASKSKGAITVLANLTPPPPPLYLLLTSGQLTICI